MIALSNVCYDTFRTRQAEELQANLELARAAAKAFHAFVRYEGTAMSLAMCKKIVERHGETITATSTPGNGSTFIIELPLKRSRL